ncbi:MATE family efflux transporter [Candidatus Epulonipiscium fishelsonii]|uniref:MATE family efflux transporter n=1 Tax=Candidatus Epulonipiscium fishelsonii TaxID=77094 RepID=A0ACC8XCM0_9FIRM|nr:MATE family efflux transporter [Epulopiscium sp. SCG-D08WGA-EpuloA1]OON93458.1 MAG: MATE family efflux transporter [Epulopiscium sp. AS2M-Bin002]
MNIEYILNERLFIVWRKFILASVIGVIFNAIYTMVDGIFVGRGVGEAGLAGVNLAWPAITIILGIGLMLGTGAANLIALSIGSKNIERAERILGITIKSALYFGIILMIIGFLFVDPIVNLLGADSDTYQYTRDYFLVVYFIAIPYLLANALVPIVRADGNPKLSMMLVMAGASGNIVLDYIFVFVLKMGTAGAALATGCGVLISTCVGLCYFTKGNSNIKLRIKYFQFDKHIFLQIIKIGIVSFVMQFSIGLVILIQNNIIYIYGNTVDVAIFSVAGYVFSLYGQLGVGIAQGMQPLIGYHYSANSMTRLKNILKLTICSSILLGIFCLSMLFLFGDEFIKIFGISQEYLSLAYNRILTFCMGMPFLGIVYTVGGYYQALNKNISSNIISIGRGIILQAGFSIILPPMLGVEGIFYAQALADSFAVIIVIIVVLVNKVIDKNRKRSELSSDLI